MWTFVIMELRFSHATQISSCCLQVWSVKYNSKGSKIISAGDDRAIHIYDCPMWLTTSRTGYERRASAELFTLIMELKLVIGEGGREAVNVMVYFALAHYGQIKGLIFYFCFHLIFLVYGLKLLWA